MNAKFNFLLMCLLLAVCSSNLRAQELKPSVVLTDTVWGNYRKVTYESQTYTYKGITCYNSYNIQGAGFILGSTRMAILNKDGKEVYTLNRDRDASYSYRPTFYFPNDKNRPFIISIADGMEYYEGSDIFIIDKDFNCTYAGVINLVPWSSNEYLEEHTVEAIMQLEDRGKKGIRFTFSGDSLCYSCAADIPFSDRMPNKGIYFTFNGKTLVPSPKFAVLPGTQRVKLYSSLMEKERVYTIQFGDVDGDGNEDVVYTSQFTSTDANGNALCKSVVKIGLCTNWEIKKTLSFELDYPSYVESYRLFTNGVIYVIEYTCKNYHEKGRRYYRLENEELVEVEKATLD